MILDHDELMNNLSGSKILQIEVHTQPLPAPPVKVQVWRLYYVQILSRMGGKQQKFALAAMAISNIVISSDIMVTSSDHNFDNAKLCCRFGLIYC